MCSKRKKSEPSVEPRIESTAESASDSQLDPQKGPASKETPASQPDSSGTPTDATAKEVHSPSRSDAADRKKDGNKGVEASQPTTPKSPQPDETGDPSVTPSEADDTSHVKRSADSTEPPGLGELFDQAKDIARQLKSIMSQKLKNGVKEAGLMFDLGGVLSRLQPTFKRGGWGNQLKSRGISTSMDWRSQLLFERARTRDAVEGLSINQAYKKFGIHKHAADQSLDRQLAALAKRVEKISGKQIDVDRCRSTIECLKASLDALLRPGGESVDSAGASPPT